MADGECVTVLRLWEPHAQCGGKVLLYADSCHSGAWLERVKEQKLTTVSVQASAHAEQTIDGVFTSHLVKVLAGRLSAAAALANLAMFGLHPLAYSPLAEPDWPIPFLNANGEAKLSETEDLPHSDKNVAQRAMSKAQERVAADALDPKEAARMASLKSRVELSSESPGAGAGGESSAPHGVSIETRKGGKRFRVEYDAGVLVKEELLHVGRALIIAQLFG